MNAGPSGFKGAPVSKGLLIAAASSSILLQAARVSRRRVPLLIDIFTQVFVFRHPGELIFGAALLYYTRLFERQFGSNKYGSFVVATCGISYLLEMAAASLLRIPSASGPYPIIFASLVPFVLDVPPLHNLQVFGWRATDKSFVYVAALQLLLSAPKKSLVAGLCGLLAGILYRTNFMGIGDLKLPLVVTEFFSNTLGLGRVLQGAPTGVGHAAQQQQQQQPRQQQSGGTVPSTRPAGPPPGGMFHTQPQLGSGRVEASREAVQQLVAMGFDEAQASAALSRSNNNVELALQYLL
ncbi:hypothetical protein N2152v2_010177 [Parachlorella kessleri]